MISKFYKTACVALAMCGTLTVAAQDKMNTVTGRVVDAATGKPLAGVIVAAYGDSRYTAMTDEKGNYELKVPDYTRSVSMTVDGYNIQQRAISEGKADGRMFHSVFSKDYNATTKATIAAEAAGFDNTAEVSIDPLIQQRLGGDMRSVNRSGLLGVGNTMLIEGINSLHANAQPLVVVDGVIMDMQYIR